MGQKAQKRNKNHSEEVGSARDTSGLQDFQVKGHWGRMYGTNAGNEYGKDPTFEGH